MTSSSFLLSSLILSLFLFSGALSQPQTRLSPFDKPMDCFFVSDQGLLETRESVFAADSGSMTVPENRRDPASRLIRIPILRVRSLDTTSRVPVFWLTGGPGQSNLSPSLFDFVISRHDQVMVGYRGVDGNVSLHCPEVVEYLEGAGDILSGDAITAVSDAFGACAERLSGQGIDLRGYTVEDVVDDLEEARRVLGYDRISLVSESYGTRVAYTYALKYADRLDRIIMVGGNPPGGMVWDPNQNDSLLMRYGELWKLDPEARAVHPDLVEAFRTVNRNFPKRWLFFPIHEGTVKASVNAFLFHTGTAAQAFDAYVSAANGDASGLWLISLVGGRIFPGMVNWGENAAKAVSLDFDPTRDYLGELNPPDALIGAPLGAFLWAPAQRGGWPVTLVEAPLRTLQRCTVPTLFLSGSLDFSTPAENVERYFVPNFPNGHHIVLSEAGHVSDLWRSQPAATDRLLAAFLETGVIDTSLVRYAPVSFEVSLGFPLLAKLLVGGFLLALAAAAWGGWKVSSKFWKKRMKP